MSDRHSFRALPDRLPAYRRRAHRAVQLALRQALRRQVPAAHRGHRPRALDRGGGRGDPRRPQLARPRLGRRGGPPVRARRAPSRGGASNCSPRAAPIAATRRPRNSTRCARSRALEGKPMRYDGRWRDRDPAEAPPGVKPVIRLARARTARRSSTTRCRARSSSPTRSSTISCCCAPTAIRPTCSRSSSTTTTWASPTSSAATII